MIYDQNKSKYKVHFNGHLFNGHLFNDHPVLALATVG
jgi:hypothetical protein